MAFCAYCGQPLQEGYRFCAGCGAPVPQTAPAAETRYLHIRRKADLFLCKAAVVLDGQQCAMLAGAGKVTSIPVSQGNHTIRIRVASGAGIEELDEIAFQVGKRDFYGEFFLQRTAFKGIYRFQMCEVDDSE